MKLFTGNNVDVLRREVADNSVDLTVTSPPYDNLRKYNGFEWDFEAVAKELFRVTKPGGVVIWIVNDAVVNGSETGTSFRQALGFKDAGFNLYDTMIWAKDNSAFPDVSRYQQVFEYMFVLSKGKPTTLNLIADKPNVSFGRTISGTHRNADGTTRPKVCLGQSVKEFGIRANVWSCVPEKGPLRKQHPAMFPEQLARDHVLSWSNPGDTVLDPFLGSGTTGKVAAQLGRFFIGVDISPEYVALAQRRISEAQERLAQ